MAGIGVLIGCLASAFDAHAFRVLAEDISAAKFHREDHRLHPYSPDHAWRPFVPSEQGEIVAPLVEDKGGDTLIVFSSLQELFRTMKEVAQKKEKKIDLLVINAHGVPGGLWFPRDAAERDGEGCKDWMELALASDEANHREVYGGMTEEEILETREKANIVTSGVPCVQGSEAWSALWREQGLPREISQDFGIILDSCTVGLGRAGESFATGIARGVLGENGYLQSLLSYGLADHSLPEGVGFWDFENGENLSRDNLLYATSRRGRDIAQPGSVRVTRKQRGVLLADEIVSGLLRMSIRGPLRPPVSQPAFFAEIR